MKLVGDFSWESPQHRNAESECDWCAPRFQTTGRLHGNAQRWESNKAINKTGHSLVQDKIEVEGALTGPLLLLLLLLLSFHRDTEEENSQQSHGEEEHASLHPRHLSRVTVHCSSSVTTLKIFTFSIYRRFFGVVLCRFVARCSVPAGWTHSENSSPARFKPGWLSFSFSWGRKKKEAVKQGRMEERSDTRGETQNFTLTHEGGGGGDGLCISGGDSPQSHKEGPIFKKKK